MVPLSALSQIMPSLGTLRSSSIERLANVSQAGSLVNIPAAELGKLSPAQLSTDTALAPSSLSPVGADSFSGMLGRMVQEVNAKQVHASETVHQLQTGGDVSLHQAVIAMEEASVSFQLMVEVRNKLLESYQELMRMQV
jgi:flagellar hook-basal body complex protein FliE